MYYQVNIHVNEILDRYLFLTGRRTSMNTCTLKISILSYTVEEKFSKKEFSDIETVCICIKNKNI